MSSGVAGFGPPVSDVIVGSGECWTPFVTILGLIESAVATPTREILLQLEEFLSRYQNSFRTLLSAKPRNPADMDLLKKALTEPVHLRGLEGKRVLPNQIVHESMLLSDILDINEFQAVDLLMTGEAEMSNYPCWGRGLVAVYLYFQGRTALYSVVDAVVRFSPGLVWGSHVSPKVLEIFKPHLNNLYIDNGVDRALEILGNFDAKKLLESLDTNLAMGDWRHRTELVKYISSIRIELAQIVFCMSANKPLNWRDTLRILEYLRSHIMLKEETKISKDEILLIIAVLFALDNNVSGRQFDKLFAIHFKKYISEAEATSSFLCPELLDFFKLSYQLSVYKYLAETTVSVMYSMPNPMAEIANDLLGDEELEFRTDIFNFLKLELFTSDELFRDEEHVMRRFHILFTDFINHMPMKVQEMKVRSEEAAKTAQVYIEQGLARPLNLPLEYENFLECMGLFYRMDKECKLAKDYFTSEPANVSLCKFTRSLCSDLPSMFISNVKVLAGLSCSYALGVFSLVKQNGHNMSLEHFFDSIMKYLMSFGSQANSSGPVFQSDAFQRVVKDAMKVSLNPSEVDGIIGYLELIQNLCYENTVKTFFTETKKHWIIIALTAARIRALPREIRAEMLEASAAMIPSECGSPETISILWDTFYNAKLIDLGSGDLRDELEEKETRLESYIMTLGFLKLMDALVKLRFSEDLNLGIGSGDNEYGDLASDRAALDIYVNYVCDSVFMKLPFRAYKNVKERWEIAALSLSILSRLLGCVPHLMIQMLSDSPLCRTTLCCLVDCTKIREMSTGPIPHVDRCSWETLNMIYQVVIRQDAYLYHRKQTITRSSVVFGIHDLLMNIHPESGKSEFLLAILKFIDQYSPRKHRNIAIQILTELVAHHSDTDVHLYSTVCTDPALTLILRHTLSECLVHDEKDMNVKETILELLRISIIHPSPNFGLFMLFVDKKVDFQNHGVNGYPRTMLHTILENAADLPDVFLTLLVLIRDDRLRGPLLRYLRTTQFFVKFYLNSFPNPGMKVDAVGHFLKCLSIELKCSPQLGPLAHALVAQESNKFLSILDKIEILNVPAELPAQEFFECENVIQAITACESINRELRVKLIDLKQLENIFTTEISMLERSTSLRLKKSVLGEAKELLDFARSINDSRTRDASKIILFDCWKQCLEVLVLSLDTLKLAGVDFVTSILRLIVDKVVHTEGSSEAFERLSAETTMTLCGILHVFSEDLSETMLNLILSYLCTWASGETSHSVRAMIYPSILSILKIMKEQNQNVANRSGFSVLVEGLCKDTLYANDVGKMLAMYLLGEIINWSLVTCMRERPIDISEFTREYTPLSSIDMPNSSRVDDEYPLVETNLDVYAMGDMGTIADKKGFSDISNISMASNYLGDGEYISTPGQVDISVKNLNQQQFHSTAYKLGPSKENMGDPFLSLQQPFQPFQQTPVEKPLLFFPSNGQETFKIGSNFATQSTVMNYMHSKGLLRHLIENLPLVDDKNLMKLFSKSQGSVHMRALLIFEAKLFMFSRFSRTGVNSTLILMENNIILKLTDMQVFSLAGYLNVNNLLTDAEAAHLLDHHLTDSTFVPLSVSQAEQMETILTSALGLFRTMVAAAPKNLEIVAQIWHFISTHQNTFEVLVQNFPKSPNSELKECLSLYISLMADIAHKLPESAMGSRTPIFRKLVYILKEQAYIGALSEPDVHIRPVRQIMQFLFNYAVNPIALATDKSIRHPTCRLVLSPKMEYDNLRICTDEELTIGNILRLVEVAASKIQAWDRSERGLADLNAIVEMGLTLVYWHVEMYLGQILSFAHREVRVEQRAFQTELAEYMEEKLVRVISEGIDGPRKRDYMHTILFRLRRLAHLQKY